MKMACMTCFPKPCLLWLVLHVSRTSLCLSSDLLYASENPNSGDVTTRPLKLRTLCLSYQSPVSNSILFDSVCRQIARLLEKRGRPIRNSASNSILSYSKCRQLGNILRTKMARKPIYLLDKVSRLREEHHIIFGEPK